MVPGESGIKAGTTKVNGMEHEGASWGGGCKALEERGKGEFRAQGRNLILVGSGLFMETGGREVVESGGQFVDL